MYLFLNGEYVHQRDAIISAYDHGYLYGLGVFETFRTYRGHPFLLKDHLQRLSDGMRALHIESNIDESVIREVVQTLLDLNGLEDAYCRLNVSAGSGEIGLQTDTYREPTIILFQKSLPQKESLTEKKATFLQLKRNTPETEFRLKSHHYLNNIAAKREIGSATDIEGIFLTNANDIAEGITSNIFWLKDEQLYTPSIQTGILNGITRQYILKLAHYLQIPVHIGEYKQGELLDADEIFFTNSIQEIVPVRYLENKKFVGKDGKYTKLFNKHYNKHKYTLYAINDLEGTSQIEYND